MRVIGGGLPNGSKFSPCLEEVSSSVLSRYLHSLFVSGLSVSTLKSHRSVFSDLGRRFACSVLRVVDLKDSFWGPWQQGDESPVLLGLSHVCVLQRDPVAGQQVLVLRTFLSFKLRPNDLPRCRCQSAFSGSALLVPCEPERFCVRSDDLGCTSTGQLKSTGVPYVSLFIGGSGCRTLRYLTSAGGS